jgi:hypothetical protein
MMVNDVHPMDVHERGGFPDESRLRLSLWNIKASSFGMVV